MGYFQGDILGPLSLMKIVIEIVILVGKDTLGNVSRKGDLIKSTYYLSDVIIT